MGISITGQLGEFIMALLVGAGLGVVYDLFRILRLMLPHGQWAVFCEDILFFLLCAGISFAFALAASNGQMRIFVLLGELIGFVVYFFTIGAAVLKLAQAAIFVAQAILRAVYRVTLAPIFRQISKIVYFAGEFCKKHLKNAKQMAKNSKNRLKHGKELLYNKANIRTHKKRKKTERQMSKKRGRTPAIASKAKKNRTLRVLIVGFVLYMCVMIVQLQIDIRQSDRRLSEYKEAVAQQELENDDLRRIMDEEDEQSYIEKMARERLQFVYPDEKVFIDISGN